MRVVKLLELIWCGCDGCHILLMTFQVLTHFRHTHTNQLIWFSEQRTKNLYLLAHVHGVDGAQSAGKVAEQEVDAHETHRGEVADLAQQTRSSRGGRRRRCLPFLLVAEKSERKFKRQIEYKQ